MIGSMLVLAGWLSIPYCMAAVASYLETPSDAQNAPSEGLADRG